MSKNITEAECGPFKPEAPRGVKCRSWAQMDCSASTVLWLIYTGTAPSTPSTLFYSSVPPSSTAAPGWALKGTTGAGNLFIFPLLWLFSDSLCPALCSPAWHFVFMIFYQKREPRAPGSKWLVCYSNKTVGGLASGPTVTGAVENADFRISSEWMTLYSEFPDCVSTCYMLCKNDNEEMIVAQ